MTLRVTSVLGMALSYIKLTAISRGSIMSSENYIELLLSTDPVVGNQAVEYFIQQGGECVPPLVEHLGSDRRSYQVMKRLSRIFGHHWKEASAPLVGVIENGTWFAKIGAAECFDRFPKNADVKDDLAKLLAHHSMDVIRCAIDALGYLGADGWAFKIREVALESDYAIEKLAQNTIEALARFVAKDNSDDHVRYDLWAVSSFVASLLRKDEKALRLGRIPVEQIFFDYKPLAADSIIGTWLRDEKPLLREWGAEALSRIRLVRTSKTLADLLFNTDEDYAVRCEAALALGQTGGDEANRALLKALDQLDLSDSTVSRHGKTLRDCVLDSLSKRLYDIETTSDMLELIDEMLTKSVDVQGHTLYALGFLRFGKDRLLNALGSQVSFIRGAAALGLARAGSHQERERLKLMESEVGNPLERVLWRAALGVGGMTENTDGLHQALCDLPPEYSNVSHIEYVWQREVLYALSLGGGAEQADVWAELMNVNLQKCLGEMNLIQSKRGIEPDATRKGATGASAQRKPAAEKVKDKSTEEPPIRVFVSYSHQNMKYLKPDSLLGYLSGLRREGFDFWYDERILTSEPWDDRIKEEINRADIALVLVSQAFLNSRYAQDDEVTLFVKKRAEDGLKIFPVILSPSTWKNFDWLASTQFQPTNNRTIETHYKKKGEREGLFLKIFEDLQALGKEIRARRASRKDA